jgi:hypothetical protein
MYSYLCPGGNEYYKSVMRKTIPGLSDWQSGFGCLLSFELMDEVNTEVCNTQNI